MSIAVANGSASNGSAGPEHVSKSGPGASPLAAPAPAAPPPAAPAKSPEVAKLEADLAAANGRLSAADKKLRAEAIERLKFKDEKKGIGAKLSAHDKYEAAFKEAGLTPDDLRSSKLNPVPLFKKLYGEGWYDKLTELRISGVPPADMIASEMERMRETMRAEFEERDNKRNESAQQAEQQRIEAARNELATDAGAFLEQSWAEYPIFDGYAPEQVARAIASHQETTWNTTRKLLTTKEAADALEEAEISRAKRVAGIPKYAGKLTAEQKPAIVPPVGGTPQLRSTAVSERRTLSNDLTATTPGAKRANRTDEERWAAINALDLPKKHS